MFFEIRNDFPNSKVGFVITHDPFTYDAEGDFESYYERIKEVCDKWDVSYLDLYAKNNSDTGVNVRDDDMRKLYLDRKVSLTVTVLIRTNLVIRLFMLSR